MIGAMIDFALAAFNVALAMWDANSVSFLNWGAAVFCFGMGCCALGDRR